MRSPVIRNELISAIEISATVVCPLRLSNNTTGSSRSESLTVTRYAATESSRHPIHNWTASLGPAPRIPGDKAAIALYGMNPQLTVTSA